MSFVSKHDLRYLLGNLWYSVRLKLGYEAGHTCFYDSVYGWHADHNVPYESGFESTTLFCRCGKYKTFYAPDIRQEYIFNGETWSEGRKLVVYEEGDDLPWIASSTSST